MKATPISSMPALLAVAALSAATVPPALCQTTVTSFLAAPGDAQVTLTWEAGTNGTGYNVKQAASASTSVPAVVLATNIPNSSLVVTNLRNGSIYYFAVSAVAGDFESADTPRLRVTPSAAVLDVLPAGAKVEKLGGGFSNTEGPVWNSADGGYLIFSDVQGNRLLRWRPGSGITTFRQPSNGANGNAVDLQGRLITCQQSTRSVTRTELDGTVTTLVTQYNGKQFNEPNDVVVKSDGTVWFTDPDFSGSGTQPGKYVYRFNPTNGNATVTPVAKNLVSPNGLCFSPDETKLYVVDADAFQTLVYDVLPDNSLTNSRIFVAEQGDGMRMDAAGRLFFARGTEPSLRIFGPDGKLQGLLNVPEVVANLCFGGTNHEMLFFTASSGLYGITRMPDLVITAINRSPISPITGQSVTFSAVVKNQGTGPTPTGVATRVAFSIGGETNVVGSDVFIAPIPPDASVVLTANSGVSGPRWTVKAGTHLVRATVDDLNRHPESNENNNTFSVNLFVAAPPPDSDGDGLDDPSEALAGTDAADAASVLKFLAIESQVGDRLAVNWSGVPGKTYQIAWKARVSDPEWAGFSDMITATGIITSWTNTLALPSRQMFLGVRVVQ